jgi:periplasmic divalent cation tolerance protein
MSSTLQIVLCTVPDRDCAKQIATALVRERLAACVNIVPGVTSVYRWQDKIETDDELLLLVKTGQESARELQERICSLHPYELPEIIAVPIEEGLPGYLHWLTDSLGDPA